MKNAILSLVLFLCSCSSDLSQQKNKQTVQINLSMDVPTLDPRKARDLQTFTVVHQLFEGLTRLNSQEKPELALAESFTLSEDLKTYTFRLRKAKWTNGDAVKASDVAYAWKKVLDPKFPADCAFQLYLIKNARLAKEGKIEIDNIGVKVLDERTLQVELEHPTAYFLDMLAIPVFFPVNARVDEQNPQWSEKAQTYVSNGPFSLKQWKHNDCISLKKNKDYWDAEAVHLQEIEMLMVNELTDLALFEKKEIDWAGSPLSILPLDALPHLKQEKQFNSKPLLGTYFFRLNTEKPPLNHPSMRRALALALNRTEILEHVTHGTQIPAFGLVPPVLGVQEAPYFKDGDIAEAKRLFVEALKALNIKVEAFPPLCLTYSAGERNHLIAQAVQQQWFEAFGLRVQLEAVESKVFFQRVSKQDYTLAAGSWIADFNDPINFLEVFKFKKASTNNTLWENESYVELLNQSSQHVDLAKRLELLRKSEKLIMEEMPIIPIFHYTMLYMKNEQIRNETVSSMGIIDFKRAIKL